MPTTNPQILEIESEEYIIQEITSEEYIDIKIKSEDSE